MIARTNAIDLLNKNLHRTEMLIEAMGKIKIYNNIYQANQTNLQDYLAIKSVQDEQLRDIEQSCAEHAIISLVTTFETYYKELIQQLFADYPDYFLTRNTVYSDKIERVIRNNEFVIYEDIERDLNLRSRFDYYNLLQLYSIPFLSVDDNAFIEYLYLRRNNYVHNAGRPDAKLQAKLAKTPPPTKEIVTSTEAKRLRTRFDKVFYKLHDQIISTVSRK